MATITEKKSDFSREISFLKKLAEVIEKEYENESEILADVAELIPNELFDSKCCSCAIEGEWGCFHSSGKAGKHTIFEVYIKKLGDKVGSILLLDRNNGETCLSLNHREILRYTAERLGRVLERYQAQRTARENCEKLEKRQEELKNKNIAMKEMLNLLNQEKKEWSDKQSKTIKKVILPHLSRLEKGVGSNMHIELIRINLRNMTTDEGENDLDNFMKLSHREIEICYLLKSGMLSKEIGDKLALSSMTVDRHRGNIRRKLDLIGTGKNLESALKVLDSL